MKADMDVVLGEPGLKILLDESMDFLVMRREMRTRRVFVSPVTWDALSAHTAAMDAFMDMAREGVAGFRLLDRNIEPWATAVARWEAEQDVPLGDQMSGLLARVQDLVAASAVTSDPAVMNRLMEEHAVARRELAALLDQAKKINALLDMGSRKLCGV